jgi:hypothetical protein
MLLGWIALGATAACSERAGGDDATLTSRAEPAACAGCHESDFQGARHHPGMKPTTCGTCHAQSGWQPTRLDHSWKLDGAHEKSDCFACHTGTPPTFRGTAKECVGCHRDDDAKANAKLDWHVRAGTACAECHGTSAWKPVLAEAEARWQTEQAATPSATVTAPATTTAPPTATAPKPKPTVTATPKPTVTATPKPTVTATATATATVPDVVTKPSRRR